MAHRPLPPRLGPGPLSRADAEAINRWIAEMHALLGGFSASAPLALRQDATGVNVSLDTSQLPGDVVLKVTSTSTTDSLYPAVIESCTNADGDPPSFSEGQACWAWGLNGATLSEQQYDGFLQLGVHSDGNPVFAVEAGSDVLTVETVNEGEGDEPVTVSGCTQINTDQASGLLGTNPSGNIFQIACQPATTTHNGVVTTGNDTWSGNKETNGNLISNGNGKQLVQIGSNYQLEISAVPVGFGINSFGIGNSSLAGCGMDVSNEYFTIGTRNSSGAYQDTCYDVVDSTGSHNKGIYATVNYTKPDGGTGTLTFAGGILVGST